MSDNEDFDQGDAGSTDTIPMQAGSIKKGGYCMLKGFPCKVSDYSTAKPGKHGSAKATIVGNDIFSNKRYEEICPTSANIRVPIVQKKEFEVADISEDDFASLIQDDGTLKSDLKLPKEDEEIYAQLKKVWEGKGDDDQCMFTVIKACGKEKIIAGRTK